MFSKNSSSIHTINSDFPLKTLPKISYLFFNLFQLSLPSFGKRHKIKKFIPESQLLARLLDGEKEPISPSRLLSNVFWNQINFESMSKVLGQKFRAIEIGCGTGIYGKKLVSTGFVESYVGLDVVKRDEWKDLSDSRISFVQSSYENFTNIASGENFIFTQSALEHFEHDLKLFEDINAFASASKETVIAIHVFPSAACLATNLWHGIRQYGRFAIWRILSKNASGSWSQVISLGGKKAVCFHLKRITIPQVFRKRYYRSHEITQYRNDLQRTMRKDASSESKNFASFYATFTIWTSNSEHREKCIKIVNDLLVPVSQINNASKKEENKKTSSNGHLFTNR